MSHEKRNEPAPPPPGAVDDVNDGDDESTNDLALWIVLGCFGVAAVIWFAVERKRFAGPPGIGARPSPPSV